MFNIFVVGGYCYGLATIEGAYVSY